MSKQMAAVCVFVKVLAGTAGSASESASHFISTSFHDEFLADMMQSHMVRDFCVIGPRVSSMMYDCECCEVIYCRTIP